MSRLTRGESQARTRDALLETAQRAFLRDGYRATSLEKVADEAGFSKGAVYSNFGNKDDLCLAVLDRIHRRQTGLIEKAMRGPADLHERLAAFGSWAEQTIGDPGWTGLECEFATHVRNRPELRRELARRDAAVRDLIATLIGTTAEELGVELPMPPHDAAAVMLSLGIGLGVRRMVDPDAGVDILTDMVRLLFGATD